jgi:hypothetical protein
MRRKNTRPTFIYWLLDIRPETIAAGWPAGCPFYCGKSVRPNLRLGEHKKAAARGGALPVHGAVRDSGKFLILQAMETVPADGDWVAREKSWIRTLRHFNPDCANVADGGSGAPGFVLSEPHREILRLANTGRPKTTTELAAIGAAHRGKIVSEATRAKLRAAKVGKPNSDESKAKQSSALRGKKQLKPRLRTPHSQETKEKIRLKLLGTNHTAERCANISAASKGKKQRHRSPEHCAKIAANKRAWHATRKSAA